MTASELLELIDSLPGSREAGSGDRGVHESRTLSGIEYALAGVSDERKLRSVWKKRTAGGPTPLVLFADDPAREEHVAVLGPRGDGPLRIVRSDALGELIARTGEMGELAAVRLFSEEIDRLDASGIPGVTANGLLTQHLLTARLPESARWAELTASAEPAAGKDWRDALATLGYSLERLPDYGYLATYDGHPVVIVHPYGSPSDFSRLGEEGRLPEGALLAACERHHAPWGILASGTRLRLFDAREDGGAANRYLELDSSLLDPEMEPLVGLLAPPYLACGGLDTLAAEIRANGAG